MVELLWQTWANEDNQYYVIPSKKIPFVDNFQAGAVIPGIEIAPLTGGRADILARNRFGAWTLEVMRSLKTEGDNADTQDVQFTDMDKSYPFGMRYSTTPGLIISTTSRRLN